jgi:hypothetical protein
LFPVKGDRDRAFEGAGTIASVDVIIDDKEKNLLERIANALQHDLAI